MKAETIDGLVATGNVEDLFAYQPNILYLGYQRQPAEDLGGRDG